MKTKNIHTLPTNKPSHLYEIKGKSFFEKYPDKTVNAGNQNIYITSDEEVKEPCWCFDTKENTIKLYQGGLSAYEYKNYKKIILTTDTALNHLCGCGKDCGAEESNIQAIDDEFLEWFVQNPSCEEVKVSWVKTPDGIFYHKDNVPYGCYKIVIPKEEPNDFGDIVNEHFWDLIEIKQETLEEAANNYLQHCRGRNNIHLSNVIHAERCKNDFKAGAKWQQERSYSEDDMRKAFIAGFTPKITTTLNDSFNKWFEQLKKT